MSRRNSLKSVAFCVVAMSVIFDPVSAHMLHLQTKSSDFNGDGQVDFTDFVAFAGAFGSSEATYDLDSSGQVDFFDFLTLSPLRKVIYQ